jgi:FkbM family methyltransferase
MIIVVAGSLLIAFLGCTENTPKPSLKPEVAYRAYPLNERPYRQFKDSQIADMDAYIDTFPVAEYKVYEIKNFGKMFVDNIDDAIKNELRKGAIWEEGNVQLINKYARPGSTFIDVGAHIGTITIPAARKVGQRGRVVSFEPQPKIFRELNHNLMLNGIKNVSTYRFAISDKVGQVNLFPLVSGNEGGTPIDPNTNSKNQLADAVTLDSFDFKDVSFIKIDVEGWEEKVLRSSRKTIMKNRPVLLVEIMGGFDYDKAPRKIRRKIDATKSLIASMGYEVSRVGVNDYLGLPVE